MSMTSPFIESQLMSEKLKQYRLNIINSKITLEGIDDVLVLIISALGVLVALVPTSWSKMYSVAAYIILLIIFSIIRFFVRKVHKSIEADNNYLDEEVLLLKEYAYDLEVNKRLTKANLKQLIQIQGFVAALDYMLECEEKILNIDSSNFDKVHKILDDTFAAIYNSLHNNYEDYQEKITLALYVYSQETGKFLDFISKKPNISTYKKGRIWKETDDAHICYVARHPEHTEFIFNDINNELPKPENFDENDINNYVSSISIPMFFVNGQIRAVLSITSNYISRFDRFSENGFLNNCNTILISYLSAIAKTLEIILNDRFPMNNNVILWHTIREYKAERQDQITEDLERFLTGITK